MSSPRLELWLRRLKSKQSLPTGVPEADANFCYSADYCQMSATLLAVCAARTAVSIRANEPDGERRGLAWARGTGQLLWWGEWNGQMCLPQW